MCFFSNEGFIKIRIRLISLFTQCKTTIPTLRRNLIREIQIKEGTQVTNSHRSGYLRQFGNFKQAFIHGNICNVDLKEDTLSIAADKTFKTIFLEKKMGLKDGN